MRLPRFPLFVGLLLGASLGLMQCGGSKCDAKSCPTGCCDSKNLCQPGTATSACGKAGAACSTCATGQLCLANICGTGATGGGTGGGSMGGGTGGGTGGGAMGGGAGGGATGGGTGGGGGTTCRMVGPFDPPSLTDVGYLDDPQYPFNYSYQEGPALTPDAGLVDLFNFEFYWFNMPTLPVSAALAPTTYADCDLCVWYGEDCGATSCSKWYLAQSGNVTVVDATQSLDAGVFESNGTNIRFVEWDDNTDQAVAGGTCVIVNSYAFDGGW